MTRLLFVLALVLLPLSVSAQSADDLFQQALALERTEGDLLGAIAVYRQVVDTSDDRGLSAQALLRIGENYERLGRDGAVAAYRQIVSQYSDQAEPVGIARERLSGLTRPAHAAEAPVPGAVAKLYGSTVEDWSYTADISADGRLLARAPDQGMRGLRSDEASAIDIVDLESGEVRLVDTAARCGVSTLRFSPDGRHLGYACYYSEETAGVIDLQTGIARTVIPDTSETELFDWTQDGRAMLLSYETNPPDPDDELAQLILQPIDGSAPTIIDGDYWHDGGPTRFWESYGCLMRDDRILFGDTGATQTMPFTISRWVIGEGEPTAVFYEAGRNYFIMGCDKANNVLYFQEVLPDNSAWLWASYVDPDGSLSQRTRLMRLQDDGVWAQSGAQNGNLYFTNWGKNWRTVWKGQLDFAGGSAQLLSADAGTHSDRTSHIWDWSPDGKYRVGGRWGRTYFTIDGGAAGRALVIDTPQRVGRVGVGLDRVMVVGDASTWVYDLESGELVDSVSSRQALQITPSGSELVFLDVTSEDSCLTLYALEDRSETPLRCIGIPVASANVEFSRDGSTVLVTYATPSSDLRDLVFRIDGSFDRTFDNLRTGVELLPDGRGAILIAAGGLTLRDFETGRDARIETDLPPGTGFRPGLNPPRWKLHPDGTRFEAELQHVGEEETEIFVIRDVRALRERALERD